MYFFMVMLKIMEDDDALLLLQEVYTQPADVSGPLSPARLALAAASLAALPPANARAGGEQCQPGLWRRRWAPGRRARVSDGAAR